MLLVKLTWASADFFPGAGGWNLLFASKEQKSLKTYYFWPARGGGARAPLPSPADAM